MLKGKLKKCKKCGWESIIWRDGMCAKCASIEKSPVDLITSTFGKRPSTWVKKTKKPKPQKLLRFYEEQVDLYRDNPYSFESNLKIGLVTAVNIAHIFPKQKYKSLQCEPQNVILLTWLEHTRFDELLGAHDFEKLEEEFKSWSKICERIKELLPLCQEEGNLKTALKNYLNEKGK